MKSTKSIALICCCVYLMSTTARAQNRVSITWEVLKYDIVATLPQNFTSDRDLKVVANLRLKNASDRTFSRLTMRISDKAEISSVAVNGAASDFRKREEGGSLKLQRVIVSLPSIAPNSTFSVKVNYKLKVKSNSGLNSLSPVGSQFLPMSFWYPTPNSWFFTGGADFAPHKIRVNGAAGLTVLSSGAEIAGAFEQNLNGQPFFTMGRWDVIDSNGVKVFLPRGVGEAGKTRAAELAGLFLEAKDFVTARSGKSVAFPLRIVAVNRGAGFSDSGTVFVDDGVFKRNKLDAQTALILIEAAVKSWLGNVVEVQGEGYGVIREGLSKFISTQFVEKKFGKSAADIERLKQRSSYSAIASRDTPLSVVSPVDGYYFTATSNKGAMIWKYLFRNFKEGFYKTITDEASDGILTLDELRAAFSSRKQYLDYMLDKNTRMNLMVGVPQYSGNQSRVAVRNISEVEANVEVVGVTASGQRLVTNTTIPANGWNEAVFRNPEKIVSAEIDVEKIYPQTNYIDDIAPREIGDNDPILFIKRELDRQRFPAAEKNARLVLKLYPDFDEALIFLGRSLLAQNKLSEAGRRFQEVLGKKLPTARSLAWANVGLGEVAAKTGRNSEAISFFKKAIEVDGDFGASLAARSGRNKLNSGAVVDASISKFFSDFDSAVVANSKSRIDSKVITGEISLFASSVAGQAQEWKTAVKFVDPIDSENVLVETNVNVRLLNRENESGLAVFRLTKVAGAWKLSGVEIFEVG